MDRDELSRVAGGQRAAPPEAPLTARSDPYTSPSDGPGIPACKPVGAHPVLHDEPVRACVRELVRRQPRLFGIAQGSYPQGRGTEQPSNDLGFLGGHPRVCGEQFEHAIGEGDQAQLAARVVLQAMLPGAVRMTRRCLRDGEASADVAQLTIASLYQVVRRFPITRRRQQLARNLRLELWHLVSRELGREFAPSGEELPGENDPVAGDTADPVAQAEVVLLASAAHTAGLHSADEPVEELTGERGELVELLVWALPHKVLTTDAATSIADHYRETGAITDATAACAAGVSTAA